MRVASDTKVAPTGIVPHVEDLVALDRHRGGRRVGVVHRHDAAAGEHPVGAAWRSTATVVASRTSQRPAALWFFLFIDLAPNTRPRCPRHADGILSLYNAPREG